MNQELKKVLEKRAISLRSWRNPLRNFAIQYSCNAKNTKGYAKLRKVFRFLLLIRIIYLKLKIKICIHILIYELLYLTLQVQSTPPVTVLVVAVSPLIFS